MASGSNGTQPSFTLEQLQRLMVEYLQEQKIEFDPLVLTTANNLPALFRLFTNLLSPSPSSTSPPCPSSSSSHFPQLQYYKSKHQLLQQKEAQLNSDVLTLMRGLASKDD